MLVLVLLTVLLGAPPAGACACGAVVTGDDGVHVDGETALVRHDGRTEEIVMGLTLTGEPRDAAWILPVPATPTFDLGPERLFTDLAVLTRPRVRVVRDWFPRWNRGASSGGASDGAPRTSVVARETVGPYDVATLAASDGTALSDWLTGHGYRLPPAIATGVAPYAQAGWRFVAVKLSAAPGRDRLGSALPPLRVRFPSATIVYPMRLTALATAAQHVRLYVLAAHRVRSAGRVGPTEADVRFAGRVGPSTVAGTALADVVDGPLFLTRFDQYLGDPATVTDDYRFERAADDASYREVETVTEPVYVVGIPAGPLLVALGLLILLLAPVVVAALVLIPRAARRRPSGPTEA